MMFSPDTYQQRRQALLRTFQGSGLLLFTGNDESPMNFRDNVYSFRQDSTFLYFFGIDRPGFAAVMDCDAGTTTLYGEDMTIDHVIWMGPQPTMAEFQKATGVDATASPEQLPVDLRAAASSARAVHYLPPYRGEATLQLANLLQLTPAQIESGYSEAMIQAVVDLRSIKSDEELEQLELACTLTANMHITGMKTARPGMLESEVMAAVRAVPLGTGRDVSFPIICSIHGEVLHNHHYENRLESGRLLLLDAGGESAMHYAGDMTRTFPVDATFTTKQREVYQIVLDSMEASYTMLRPGVAYRDVHLAAARVLTSGLQQLGLMRGDVDESVAAGAHGVFFPHGLGHMMGLDVHDMENLGEQFVGYGEGFTRSTQLGLKSLRLARHLQERFVITVEPGLYFVPPLIGQWKANRHLEQFINYDKVEGYLDFGGIRIEDDIVITADGYRILGEPAPKTVADVEAVRQEALS